MSAATNSSKRCRSHAPNTSSGSLLESSAAAAAVAAEGMEGSKGSKNDWSEMSASRATLSGLEGERSARRVGAWLRWAREERSSWPSDFTSSWVRAPDLDFRFLVPDADAVADDDFPMVRGCAREAAARRGWGLERRGGGEVGGDGGLDPWVSGVY